MTSTQISSSLQVFKRTNTVNRMVFVVCFTLLWSALSTVCGAATYYVDNNGSDSYNGLYSTYQGGTNGPWQTIGKVNAGAYSSGDNIYFHGGQTFSGCVTASSSGTSGYPITYGSWGTGAATINSGTNYGFWADSKSGITVYNLNFIGSGAYNNTTNGIDFRGTSNYISVSTVNVSGYGSAGISIVGTHTSCWIQWAYVHDCKVCGIYAGGASPPYPSPRTYGLNNVYIGNCTVWNIAGDPNNWASGIGIWIVDANAGTIEYCVTHDLAQYTQYGPGGPVGIMMGASTNGIVQYNEAYNVHAAGGANGYDGGGFDFDGGESNSVMQYNYSHDNDTIGYFCFQYDTPYPGPHTNNTYRYNISQNDGKVGAYGDGIEVRGSNGQLPTNFHIYNNTVYVTPSPNPNRTYGPNVTAIAIDSGSNGDVRNNICYSTTQDKIAFIGAGATVNFQGNDYWAANGGLNLNGYTSLSAWQSATGEETINGTALGYAINPVLTNPGGGGTLNNPHNMATLLTAYKLQNTSPMLKTGQNLSYWGINPGSYDFYGNSVSGSWAGIGAHTPNQTDATNFIANPGFETGTLANWSTWTDGVPGGWSPWVASGGGGAHSGTYYLVEQQGSTRSRVQVYQGLTGIPNGTYTFTAWLWGQGWSSPSYGEIGVHAFTSPDTYLYATDNPAGDGRWVQYPISNINVTTNGIYPFVESSLQNQWFCADDLSLQLVGPIQHQ